MRYEHENHAPSSASGALVQRAGPGWTEPSSRAASGSGSNVPHQPLFTRAIAWDLGDLSSRPRGLLAENQAQAAWCGRGGLHHWGLFTPHREGGGGRRGSLTPGYAPAGEMIARRALAGPTRF